MAEIASQGRVGSQGGGEATVFDTSAFYNQMYNIQRDVAAKQEQKKKEYEKQQATWNALLEDPGDVWQSDYEYVNKAVTEYNDFIIDLKAQGLDPETLDSSLMRKMKQLESNIRKTTSAAKDNETYSNQSFGILNQDKAGKYNKDYAAKWLQDYADPKKSPQDRAKMRIESNPFKLNYNIIDFVDKTIPEESVDDTGRKKVTYRDENAHKSIVLSYIQNDPLGEEMFESLKEPGETEIAFAERVAKLGQNKYQPKTDVQPAPQPRNSDGDGDKKDKDKVVITGKLKVADPKWDQTYTANKLSVGKTPAIYAYSNAVIDEATGAVSEESKAIMNFVPQDGFYLKPGGAITAIGYGTDEDSKQVKVEVDYDKNKGNFDAQGYPNMFDAFRGISGGGTSTSTGSTSTGGAETPAQRAARIAAGG